MAKNIGPLEGKIEWILSRSLPVAPVHEPQLRMLIELGGSVGGAAAKRLVEIKGNNVKDELLQQFVSRSDDYNFCCNGIAQALKPLATIDDIQKILSLADSISAQVTPESHSEAEIGFTSGVAIFIEDLEISAVREAFLPQNRLETVPEIRARILCHFLWRHHSSSALDLAAELLLRGVDKAATSIVFIAKHRDAEVLLSWDSFTSEHIDRLVALISDPDEGSWSVGALCFVCLARQDLVDRVNEKIASSQSAIGRACLRYCAEGGASERVFEALEGLIPVTIEIRRSEPLHLLKQINLDWQGREELLVRLLRLRDVNLANCLIGSISNIDGRKQWRLNIGPIEWWLSWFKSEAKFESGYWLGVRLSALFSWGLERETWQLFLAEFNRTSSEYREVLASLVLPNHPDLTTDDFNEDAVSFLLRTLSRSETYNHWDGHMLGNTATEHFVSERLLPLLTSAKGAFRRNLVKVLRRAGSRHGRRYST